MSSHSCYIIALLLRLRNLSLFVFFFFPILSFGQFQFEDEPSEEFKLSENLPSLISPDHTAFGFLKKLSNGRLLHIFRSDSGITGNHVGVNGTIVKRFSDDDGVTWTTPEVIYKDEYDDRNFTGGILDDGEIVLFFGRYKMSGTWTGEFIDVNYLSSTDNGITWSDRKELFSGNKFVCLYNIFKIPGLDGYFAASYYNYLVEIRHSDDGHNWDSVYYKWDYNVNKELNIVEPVFIPLENGKIIGLFRVENTAIHQTISEDYGKTWSLPVPTNLAKGSFCSYPNGFYDPEIGKFFAIVSDRRGSTYDDKNNLSGSWVYCQNINDVFLNPQGYSKPSFIKRARPDIFRFLGYPITAKTNDSTYICLYNDCYKKQNNLEDAEYYQFYIHLDKTIYQKDQSIELDTSVALEYNNPMIFNGAKSSSHLPVDIHSSDSSIAYFENGKIIPVKPGNCIFTAYQPGNNLFRPAKPLTMPVFVDKASQLINVEMPYELFIDNTFVPVDISTTSNLKTSIYVSDTTILNIINDSIQIVGSGLCTIRFEQSGNDFYYPAPFVTESITIHKLPQTKISDTTITSFYKAPDIQLKARASSGLLFRYISSDTNVVKVYDSLLKIVDVGLCAITAFQDLSLIHISEPTRR